MAVLMVSFLVGATERIATIPADTANVSCNTCARRIASMAASPILHVFKIFVLLIYCFNLISLLETITKHIY